MPASDKIKVVDVVRLFVRLESGKQDIQDRYGDISQWLDLPNSALIAKVKRWKRTHDNNPTLRWTVGLEACHVGRWTKEIVPLDSLFTCGINPKMQAHLESVRWNIAAFAQGPSSHYPEFEYDLPPSELRTLIGVRQLKSGKKGSIQLIDGAHRAVALIRNGVMKSPCYIAETE